MKHFEECYFPIMEALAKRVETRLTNRETVAHLLKTMRKLEETYYEEIARSGHDDHTAE